VAEVFTDGIVCAIAKDGGDCKKKKNRGQMERAGGGQRPEGEKQGVAGKKRGYDQAGFAKDDEKENQVTPQAVVFDDVVEVLIEVQDEVNQPKAQFK